MTDTAVQEGGGSVEWSDSDGFIGGKGFEQGFEKEGLDLGGL